MSRRHGWTLIAMGMGLLAPLGCAGWHGVQVDGPAPICAAQTPAPSGQPAEPHAMTPGGQPAAEMTPQESAKLCLAAGEALEKKGYTAEAVRQYESARTSDPQLKFVSRRLAVLYDLQGDVTRAETEYLRALNEQPGDAELLNDVGYFHYRHDRAKNAEMWLRNAVAVDPNCRCAWINLGQVLAKQGRAEDSYQAFARALRPAEAYSNLGVLLAKQGRTAEARAALQKAVALDPTLKQAQAFLNALPRPPATLPPGLTRTPSSPAPIGTVALPPPRIITRPLPPSPESTYTPTRTPTTSATFTAPALPSTYTPPVFVTTAPPRSPAGQSPPQPVPQRTPSPSVPSPPPAVTYQLLPPTGRTTPTLTPVPSPVVPSTSVAPPVVSPKPPSSPPVDVSPSVTRAVPVVPPPPAFLPASIPSAPPVPANGANLRASADTAAEPELEGRSPIVILTDCERSADGSPR